MDAHVDMLVRGLCQRGQHDGAQQDAEDGGFHRFLLVAARATRRAMSVSCLSIVEKK
jgi:hypothetical protein